MGVAASIPGMIATRRRRLPAVVACALLGALILLASAIPAFAAGPGALVDAGFENGTAGTVLASPPWTANGVPQHMEYSNTRAKTGSQSAWIMGPVTASNAGTFETATGGMTANGSEMRFWLYLDNTTNSRLIDDFALGVAGTDRAFGIQFASGGSINVLTDRLGNPNGYTSGAYTPVGTYGVGWTQYRLVYSFSGASAQTYTLSKRASAADAWTPLKASGATGFDIPFRGVNTINTAHGTLWRTFDSGQMWLDDLVYADGGIVDPPPADTTPPTAPATLLAADRPGDTGGAIDLNWTASIDNVGVTGYRLYRGTSSGVYGVPTALGNVTAYTDNTVTTGTRYYYAVTAVDAAGNESAKSPEAFATALDNTPPTSTGTLVDAGFENGTAGTLLASPPWTANGVPQHMHYDNTRAKTGSQSAWIMGPVTASNAGTFETVTGSMTANGSEMRFWLYLDNTANSRLVDDFALGVAVTDRAFGIQFAGDGSINVLTDRAGNPNGYTTGAYTSVGTYGVGWTQYRLAYNFTGTSAQTYTLSKRASATDAWTPLKASGATGFSIPFRGVNTITQTHGSLWRTLDSGQMWLDDLAYSATTIVDPPPTDTTPPTAPATLLAADHPGDNGGAIDLNWTASIDNVGVTGYRLYRGTASGVYGAPTALGNVTAYTDNTVTTGTRYYYAVTAVDAAGNESAKSPEAFATALDNTQPPVGGDMPLGTTDCDSCHAPHVPDYGVACNECHDMAESHPGTPSEMHIPADVTGCTPCHNASLTVEHNGRKTTAGTAIDCLTCHNSSDPKVATAIATKNSACSACHALAGNHTALHATVVPPVACQASGCHPGTNLLPIHSKLNCAGCHESSRPVVIAAIAAGDKRCATCHPTADHAALHVTADPAVACQASGCHPGTNLLPTHSTGACAGCHQSSNPAVIAAIAAGDKRCATCHPGGGAHAASHNGGVSRSDCLDCHKSNIAEEHANNCDKCHKSTDPRVVAAIANHKVTCGECHTPALHATGFWSPKTDYYAWTSTPGPRNSGTPLGEIGSNPANPGPHAGYLATTAKCGICHSVHRAAGTGVKLLPTADASCAGCHAGSTTITAKQITAGVPNMNWRAGDSATTEWAYGGAGPHNDGLKTLYDDGEWDGISAPVPPSFSVEPFARYGCFTRRCHATNPHGANSSKYKIFASKLLFNDSPAADNAEYPELVSANGPGTYGGLDAKWDAFGATDAAVERFVSNNSSIMSTTAAGDILIHGVAPNAAETKALVAGLTCGRPSNPATGEDECHAEASYAVVDKGIKENRNHGTKISGNDGTANVGNNNAYRTDNTGAEAPGFGGNDNRDSKTGHVAGSFAAVPGSGSYAPIAGCTSCHNQTDSANTVAGNYTFPHGQTPVGTTNALAENGTTGTMVRSRIWSGIGGSLGATQTVTNSTSKAFDGQCLKCHRGAADSISGEPTQGIGITR